MYRESAASFEFAHGLGVAGDAYTRPATLVARRRFLMISAPFGPFGRELGHELRALGAPCTRVILNGGDALDWGFGPAVTFSGDPSGWRAWLSRRIRDLGVTDLITYGDSCPYAVEALILARTLGVRRHVLEQGYFRPDWVTLERDGVNGNSPLPRDPEWYLRHPARDREEATRRVGRTTPLAVFHITRHHIARFFCWPFFHHYRPAYRHSAMHQALAHVRRFITAWLAAKRSKRDHDQAMRAGSPMFLALLQRPGDSQLWRHSDYETAEAFLERVIPSFAGSAPADAHLIVRPHPLDPGIDDHGELTRRLAAREGAAGRVHYLDHGKLHDILPNIRGAVCVNSTAGLSAVEFGKPTATLGKAIYDMPGLTHQHSLDSFWTSAQSPDAALYLAFRRVVMATSQVNGAYATAFGRQLAVPEMARRMMEQTT